MNIRKYVYITVGYKIVLNSKTALHEVEYSLWHITSLWDCGKERCYVIILSKHRISLPMISMYTMW